MDGIEELEKKKKERLMLENSLSDPNSGTCAGHDLSSLDPDMQFGQKLVSNLMVAVTFLLWNSHRSYRFVLSMAKNHPTSRSQLYEYCNGSGEFLDAGREGGEEPPSSESVHAKTESDSPNCPDNQLGLDSSVESKAHRRGAGCLNIQEI